MDNETIREQEQITNLRSAVPPPPFCVGSIIIRQPSEREIYTKQIEPWEQSCLLEYESVEEYTLWEQYWEANDLDDIRLEVYEMHIYSKTEKAFLKWRDEADGAGEVKKEHQIDLKTEYCRVCKKVQDQMRPWTRRIEIRCFHKEREQCGRDMLTKSSIKTLMAIAWVEIQMPKKDIYVEEETSPRGAAAYNITFNFNKKVTGDIRDKLPVPFLRHVMQQAIISEKEHGPDIGYSEFKIRRTKCRVDVKFMK